MKFEELNERLQFVLTESGKEGYSDFQQQIISLAKNGKNYLFKTHLDEELIQTIYFLSFFKAPEMLEGSPRVLWITSTPEKARTYVEGFKKMIKRADVTIEIADNKGKIIEQRNAIFEGTEVLVGNPKRLLELYNQNGFHVGQITLFIIDHLSEICKDPLSIQAIRRINESLPKCQKILLTDGEHPKITTFSTEICNFYEEVELS